MRGKCQYGPRHESVVMVGGEWLGESTNEYGCHLAPSDPCGTCAGTGRVPLSADELAAEQADAASQVKDKPCRPCKGLGQVLGPHWPYRHPQPGPLRRDSL